MANRRMFSKDIVGSDAFLDMPATSQLLYFHLGMEADDDGFVSSPSRISRTIGANDDDIKVLLGKRFIIAFPSGIIVIKHWKINNSIQVDRYHETQYLEEKKALITKENKSYTECIQDVSKMDSQSSLGKSSLGKSRQVDMSEKSDAFDQFWTAYPKKELKRRAREIWGRKGLDSKVAEILSFIASASLTDRWTKGYIKQPTAFLNGECWNDDLAAYNDKKATQKIAVISTL